MGSRRSARGCPRREFFRAAAGTAATALGLGACGGSSASGTQAPSSTAQALDPRVGLPNPFINESGMPILLDIEGQDFAAMLDAGLHILGGLGRLIPSASDVLIKPNFNMAEEYPGISRASSIVTLVGHVRETTQGRVIVADEGYDDGPSVYTYLGLYGMVQAAGGEVGTLLNAYPVRREGWDADKPSFLVYSLVYDSPVVISLCNLKRHWRAGFSCAIKNNVGAVAGSRASETRHYLHHQSRDFTGDLAEVASFANPELFIVDAQSVLTRTGPSVHEGVPVEANRLIICGDMVATDAYCARLLARHDPTFSVEMIDRQLAHAVALGLGTADLDAVEVVERRV